MIPADPQTARVLERIVEQVRLVTNGYWSGCREDTVPADLAMIRLSQACFSGEEEWDTPRPIQGIIAAVQDGQPTGVIVGGQEEVWGSDALNDAVAAWITERIDA